MNLYTNTLERTDALFSPTLTQMATHSLVDFSPRAEPYMSWTMYVETKFLRLGRAAAWGDDLDGWRVCWLGGWDKYRMLFVVMVERVTDGRDAKPRRPC